MTDVDAKAIPEYRTPLKRARRLHASFGGTAALRKRAGDRFIESLLTTDCDRLSKADADREEVVQCR